jgi:PAS domain S-box-containing protein
MNYTEVMANVGGWKLNLQDQSLIVTQETLKLFSTDDKAQLYPVKLVQYFEKSSTLQELITKAIRKASSFDTVLRTTDDRYFRIIAKPLTKKEEVYKLILVFQNVTLLEAQKKSLNLFKAILDNAKDLVYVYNRKGDLLYYSESVSKTLQFSKKELDNVSIFDLDQNITTEWWNKHFDDIIAHGALHFEWQLKKKDGTPFPVDIWANHIVFKGQDLNCAVIRDITEQKAQEHELFNALEEIKSLKNKLENENDYLQEEIKRSINFDNIICQSKTYRKVLNQVDLVAPTDTTVLITGESGTGKELLASAVHNNSLRKLRPLIKVNCATLPKDLIESELFGHKKGAFTGAIANKVGKFTLADGGTIFLDEIGELPIDLQPKLLRVLQEGEFDRLGDTQTQNVDVRVIAATNRNLEEMIAHGNFREDLYYRLNVFPIHNIPLRERKEDIPILAQFFLEKYAAKAGRNFKRLSKHAIADLMRYNFPGNIRELENIIERAVIVEQGSTLKTGDWLPKNSLKSLKANFTSFETMQRNYIIEVLNHTKWRVSGDKGAAQILDMNAKTLFAKMKRLGIERT